MKNAEVKRAIITGGTGGLGKAISSVFQSGGWEVICLGRKDLDLSDPVSVREFFQGHPCDLLICAAGAIKDAPLTRMVEEDWDEVFDLNYTAAELCAKEALPAMLSRSAGHVVFISSYAAVKPAVGQAAYAAAKAALLGLTKDLALRFGQQGVRVNVVAPGFLETPMTQAVSERRKEVVRDLHFLKNFNTPEMAAEFIYFLQEHMPMTSGQFFQLDSRP